jgi:hypothetical protein
MSNSPSNYTPIDALEQSKLDEALEQSKSRLAADHVERSAQRRARYAEDARMQDRVRDLMFGQQLRSKEAELKQLAEDRRKLIEGRPKLVGRPLLTKGLPIQPSPAIPFTYGGFPPYDFTWTSGSGQGTESATTDGFIDLFVQGLGDERSVAGAIGVWFQAAAESPPVRRFSTSVSFSYEWSEGAQLYVADNHGHTRLMVWGMSENAWVAMSGDQPPSWSDHVGWYESHHDSNPGAQAFPELFFNAQPNGWYQCWLVCSAYVYADHGVAGFSDSTIRMHIALAAVFVT